MGYNGWSNRETWLVNVWCNQATLGDIDYIRETIEETIQELRKLPMGDVLADMLTDGEINWDELAEHTEESEEV